MNLLTIYRLLITALVMLSSLNRIAAQEPYQMVLDSSIVEVSVLIEDVFIPWEIVWGPDDRLWVTNNYGTISCIEIETGTMRDLAQVPDIYNGSASDARMMGLTFHPDFESEPYVYTNYTYKGAAYTSKEWDKYLKIVQYSYDETQDILEDPVVLIDGIKVYDGWHVGGKLLAGPDHKLYMTVGDAKQPESPTNHPDWDENMVSKPLSTDWYSGKVIRLNLDGTVPKDNPFAESPFDPSSKNYTWSIGHRNTQGLAFGKNDILYYAEHGASSDDEFGIIVKGGNYGWPEVEGFCDKDFEENYCNSTPDLQFPLHAWGESVAPSNMVYYRYNDIPEWKDCVLIATLTGYERLGEDIRIFELTNDGLTIENESIVFENEFLRIRDLAVSSFGDVYFTSSNIVLNKRRELGNDDKIIRVHRVRRGEVKDFTLKEIDEEVVQISWDVLSEAWPDSYSLFRKSSGSDGYIEIAKNSFDEGFVFYDSTVIGGEIYTYFVQINYPNGKTSKSDTLSIELSLVEEILLAPTMEVIQNTIYEDSLEIKIDLFNEKSEIRYTLDGSDPNINSFLYSGDLFVKEASIIKSRVVKKNQTSSDIVTIEIEKLRSPIINTCLDGNSSINESNEVTLTMDDRALETKYSFDNPKISGTDFDYSKPLQVVAEVTLYARSFADSMLPSEVARCSFEYTIISIIENSRKMIIYPNPVQNLLNISLENEYDGIFQIVLYSMEGKISLSKKISSDSRLGNYQLDLTDIQSGTYMLKFLINRKEIVSSKVIID